MKEVLLGRRETFCKDFVSYMYRLLRLAVPLQCHLITVVNGLPEFP